MKFLFLFLVWFLLLAISWPLALVFLIAVPFLWLLSIPFQLVGKILSGVLKLLEAIFTLPFRLFQR